MSDFEEKFRRIMQDEAGRQNKKKSKKVVPITKAKTKIPVASVKLDNIYSNSIDGDNNIIGNNNRIIHTNKIVERTIVESKPGEDHITDGQAALLKGLVSDIVTLSRAAGAKPDSFGAIYSSLLSHLSKPYKYPRIGKLRLIPYIKFDAAESYLRQWVGSLSSSSTSILSEDEARKKKYGYIKLNLKKHGWEQRFNAYALRELGTIQLTDLSLEELGRAYRTVARWKSSLQKGE